MNAFKIFLIIAVILLAVSCIFYIWSGKENVPDFTEGGHLETDFNVSFLAEWWYLNGKAGLGALDGEKKEIGFFAVVAHQESPFIKHDGMQLSHMLTFYGVYSDNNTFNYAETFIPRANVSSYIALHTPYVDYRYPDGLKRFYGSALSGYRLDYLSNDVKINLFFKTNADKTVDHAEYPLNFTTYERSYGTLHGSITLKGKRYSVTQAEGYMDHMIPLGEMPWPMHMHGWTWFEVTTKNYQAVAYAVRSLSDGYDNYTYKHLTLLDRHKGKVLSEYSGDEINITETSWKNESSRKRPDIVAFSTPDLSIEVTARSLVYLNKSNPAKSGFVDFMAFQPDGAMLTFRPVKVNSISSGTGTIEEIEEGGAFYEYLVSDMGVIE